MFYFIIITRISKLSNKKSVQIKCSIPYKYHNSVKNLAGFRKPDIPNFRLIYCPHSGQSPKTQYPYSQILQKDSVFSPFSQFPEKT